MVQPDKATDTSTEQHKEAALKFLRKRGLPPDAALYMNMLMRTRQEAKVIQHMAKSPEVVSAINDFIEYMELEITFLRNVTDNST